ncbi:MAG: N-acetylneuraminate synthase family protein [Planctomycetota bacterium]
MIRINGRPIGDRHPAYIIAEAGVNHDGSVQKALALVDVAVEAGADAVKFQMFRAADLASATAGLAAYQQTEGHTSQREMLEKLELTPAEFGRIREHCRKRGIEFIATPFGSADVTRLSQLDVPAIKVASTDLNNNPLLREVAETGLPLIVSTGASTVAEIHACVRQFRGWGAGRRLILLHCISCYPTPLDVANLRAIATMRTLFNVPCGFSDHTQSKQTGAWAVAAGACVLEKHFTLDRAVAGPDHAMSLSPPELRAYIDAVRQAEVSLGSGALGMSELEADVRAVARKSLVAARDIQAGTLLTPEMLTSKRPAGGIAPDQIESLLDRRVTRDISYDTVLTWDMLA